MQIHEGEGWRVQVDPGRHPYGALIGGQGWAVELNAQEFSGLRRSVLRLLSQHRQLLDTLMPEEELDLELDQSLPARNEEIGMDGGLFVALSGTAEAWSLRFVLTPADGSRAAEGAWSAAASPALAAALAGLGEPFGEGP